MRLAPLVLLAPLATGCVTDAWDGGLEDVPDADWGGDAKADGASRFYVSASTVEALNGDLSSLSPPCRTADAFHSCEFYLSPSSALGDFGPIGAFGPLGTLGPLGSNVWNPSAWISGLGDWSSWSNAIDGPLSEAGPLGPDGPIGDHAYNDVLPSINDWAKQLQAGGVWTVLGPLGPLGALGPLGPLGPVGGHGFDTDEGGRYVHDGRVQRTVRPDWSDDAFELVEMYDEDTAESLTTPDTSYMATGEIASDEVDVYPAKSLHAQFVTVLVVPEKSLDDYDLVVKDTSGHVLASSTSHSYIDWVQLPAPRGGRMSIEVSLAASGQFLSKTYRLYVIGSTGRFTKTDIAGDHQQRP